MNRLSMHEALKPLAWLEGTWRTKSCGEGKFPTIKPFGFYEEISFTSIGQPMFNYVAQSWHPEKKTPMHREVGFLKVIPESNKVSFLLAHNFGVTTIEEGEICNEEVKLKSTTVARPLKGYKDPAVLKVEREFKLIGDCLRQIVYMSTTTVPDVTEHLRMVYVKLKGEGDAKETE